MAKRSGRIRLNIEPEQTLPFIIQRLQAEAHHAAADRPVVQVTGRMLNLKAADASHTSARG